MKTLEFQSVGGASGDMILAALIDLGVDRDTLQDQLQSLPLERFEIIADKTVSDGLRGVRVHVKILDHHHHHHHEISNHEHDAKAHKHHAPHRGLNDITAIIDNSGLPELARDGAKRVFNRLAAAEAYVHGTTPDKIHFHEVGAVDSIVDIVGCCLARHILQADRVKVAPLPLGCGTIHCAHGILPAPAPATVKLLVNFPTVATDEPFELVTPTGAALLTEWQSESGNSRDETDNAPGKIIGTGYGFGHTQLRGRPNLLRVILRETTEPADETSDECLVIECNLDDMTPEMIGSLTKRLMADGALDVFITPVQMKKQRPGFLLTLLCRPEQRRQMLELLFRESTTFGARERLTRRAILNRRHESVLTEYGSVRIKIGTWAGADIKAKPEYEDCIKLAGESGVPVWIIYNAALAAAEL